MNNQTVNHISANQPAIQLSIKIARFELPFELVDAKYHFGILFTNLR